MLDSSSRGWLILMACCLATTGRSAAADDVVYTNDFNGKPSTEYPEWTSSPIVYFNSSTTKEGDRLDPPKVKNVDSPNGKQRFLGPFGGPRLAENTRDFNKTRVQQTVQLKLNKLPAHKSVTLACDLYVLCSWDGNNPNYGPDYWRLAIAGGPTLLDTTFSNNPKTGAYDLSNQDYPRKNSKFQTKAAAVNTLGSNFFGDAVYKLSYTFEHFAEDLQINFSSDLFEGKGTDDEGWGLDNVKVTCHTAAHKGKEAKKPAKTPK